jgi:hypothetical protein
MGVDYLETMRQMNAPDRRERARKVFHKTLSKMAARIFPFVDAHIGRRPDGRYTATIDYAPPELGTVVFQGHFTRYEVRELYRFEYTLDIAEVERVLMAIDPTHPCELVSRKIIHACVDQAFLR